MEIREMILQTLKAAGNPISAATIAQLTGLDKRVVAQALVLLKRDGDVISPVRSRWQAAEQNGN